jgi:uncharacterized membrane protein YjgN (DUF898 family)
MDIERLEPSFTAERLTSGVRRTLEIRFTGSGSEYFRIWAVNMLLTLVTLGFYLPFAKARRIRYFYANTLVDGQALSFHGDPWKMFRGYVLLVVLMGLYAGLGALSPVPCRRCSVARPSWPWRCCGRRSGGRAPAFG